jgi:hypothetical protein
MSQKYWGHTILESLSLREILAEQIELEINLER